MDEHELETIAEEAPPHRRIPAIAEAFGYVGGAFALAAVAALLATSWDVLPVYLKVGIPAVLAIAGLVGGFAIERLDEPAARRLGGFLLAVGVAALGVAVGFLVRNILPDVFARTAGFAKATQKARDWAWFVGMLAVAISGGLVWRTRKTWLQHLAFGIGVGMAAVLVLPLVPIDGPDWGAGAVLALTGVIWGALALRGSLPPDDAALTLSCLGILGGVEMMAIPHFTSGEAPWALWLGLVSGIALIAGGAWLRRIVAVGLGAAGVVGFLIQIVVDVFGQSIALPLSLLAVGFVLLAAAVYFAPRAHVAQGSRAVAFSEIAGYAGMAFFAAGTGTLIGQFWKELGPYLRIVVPAAATAVAYACALMVERASTESSRRLSQVLYAAGSVAAAVTVGMATFATLTQFAGFPEEYRPVGDYIATRDPGSWASFAGALSAIVFGAITWRFKKGSIVEIVPGVAMLMAVGTGFELLARAVVPWWLAAAVTAVLGLGWLVLGLTERLTPSNMSIAIGSVLTISGLMMFNNFPGPKPPMWTGPLGILMCAAGIGVSIWLQRGVLLGFSAGGVVMFVFNTVQTFFEGQIAAPVILLITGVTFIGMAVMVAVVMPRMRGGSGGGRRLRHA